MLRPMHDDSLIAKVKNRIKSYHPHPRRTISLYEHHTMNYRENNFVSVLCKRCMFARNKFRKLSLRLVL